MPENNETSPATPEEEKLNGLFPPVIAIISVITTFENLLVIVILSKKPRNELRIVSNCLVMNLAIADLMVGLVGEPLWISLYWVGEEASFLLMSEAPTAQYVTTRSVMVIAATASRCTLLFLTLERYVALEMPLRREKLFSSVALNLYIFLIWLDGSVTALLISFHDTRAVRLVFYFLPLFELVVILVLYMRMFMIIRKFNKALLASEVREPLIQSGDTFKLARRRECSFAKNIFLLVGTFVLCYLPFSVTRVVFYLSDCDSEQISFITQDTILLFYLSKCALNPILYTFSIPGYRWQVKKMFYNIAMACIDRLPYTSNGAGIVSC
ncbi:beta-2 adrenergic receptor-like [Stylophora pistillata]|uniref:beta-2 adrenergic receptor-like n=1 Tax=Stylophora pistillata TaxID=50429 RepID=UPI000C042D56|nr:beta-2 adrenergic receptor-like [Stylophora pistillata]XP_022786736.1 beta-2 adrenergic receptor-like [Stylophora pistillata]